MALTPKREAFVLEYLLSLNAADAYRKSHPGTTNRSAQVLGSRMLKEPGIAAAVAASRLAVTTAKVATITERKEFLTETMRATTIEPKDRIKACELLGKMEGDFVEKVEHNGNFTLTWQS